MFFAGQIVFEKSYEAILMGVRQTMNCQVAELSSRQLSGNQKNYDERNLHVMRLLRCMRRTEHEGKGMNVPGGKSLSQDSVIARNLKTILLHT